MDNSSSLIKLCEQFSNDQYIKNPKETGTEIYKILKEILKNDEAIAAFFVKTVTTQESPASFYLNGQKIEILNRDEVSFSEIMIFCGTRIKKLPSKRKHAEIYVNSLFNCYLKCTKNLFNNKSIGYLKLLDKITIKYIFFASEKTLLRVLSQMERLQSSPIHLIKKYSSKVADTILTKCPTLLKNDLNIENLPCICAFAAAFNNIPVGIVMRKVVKLFGYNIYSRDAGFLYSTFLKGRDFKFWSERVWPYFEPHMHLSEGEFPQSINKYWIPANVQLYGTDFFDFLVENDLSINFKVNALYYLRKSHLKDIDYDFFQSHLKPILLRPDCSELGFKALYVGLDDKNDFLFFPEIWNVLQVNYHDKYLQPLLTFIHNKINMQMELTSDEFLFIENLYLFCQDCESHYMVVQKTNIFNLLVETFSQLELNPFIKQQKECLAYFENRFINEKLPHHEMTHALCIQAKYLNIDKFEKLLQNCIEDDPMTIETLQRIKNISRIIKEALNSKQLENTLGKHFGEDIILNLTSLQIKNKNTRQIFIYAAYFEILQIWTSPCVLEIVKKGMDFIYNVITINGLLENLNSVTKKVFEAFINGFLNLNLQVGIKYRDEYLKVFVENNFIPKLLILVERSNLKKPSTLAIDVLEKQLTSMEQNAKYEEIKYKLFHEILATIENVSDCLNTNMRKNPETRLVIHAFCKSSSQSKYEIEAVDTLIKYVTSKHPGVVTASLNALEILINDPDLCNNTFPKFEEIIKLCINLFANAGWMVKNAILQLITAFINRFYGVPQSNNIRANNIEDLFIVFPSLQDFFYETLTTQGNENIVVVLQFFSASQIHKEKCFSLDAVRQYIEKFKAIFFGQIFVNFNNSLYRQYIEAFASICFPKDMVDIIFELINLTLIQKKYHNRCRNIILLVNELRNRYENSLICIDFENNLRKINEHYVKLINFVRSSEDNFSVILENIKTFKFQTAGWLERLNLLNDIDFHLTNIKNKDLFCFLELLLWVKIPSHCHELILKHLEQKLSSENQDFQFKVFRLIVQVFFKLNENNFEKYAIPIYFDFILKSWHTSSLDFNNVLDCIRDNYYKSQNINKVLISIFVLSHSTCKNKSDLNFIDNVIISFMNPILSDSTCQVLNTSTSINYLETIVQNLHFLYKCAKSYKRDCNLLFFRFVQILIFQELFEDEIHLFFERLLQKTDVILPQQNMLCLIHPLVLKEFEIKEFSVAFLALLQQDINNLSKLNLNSNGNFYKNGITPCNLDFYNKMSQILLNLK